ncbi:MAG: tetratricopeptide repeat protein [bacterium]
MERNWKITGYIATVVIVLAFPAYIIKAIYIDGFGQENVNVNTASFVGSKACLECHIIEYDLWLQSDHYFAMDTADDKSVLGNFNNAVLERKGKKHKLFRKEGKFFAHTDGPDGQMEDFEISYTFGAWPLQQYLVKFPGGRLQTLALTWDTITKSWYHMADAVYAGQDIDHTNWLHWTNQAQNWNGMCADCHSTNLVKGFDINSGNYHTTWSEITVGCEACHGPSSEHLKWAALPPLARPQDNNTALLVKTSDISNTSYVDLCARCHSRRSALDDFHHGTKELLDHMIPALAIEPNYFIDGQILEEDYVYGSFAQSKMYMNDVQCNDCHNVHSGKLILQDNDLCLQCHRADLYDTYSHHFHKYAGEDGEAVVSEFGDTYQVGEGASCINCHMPGRYYMGVDYRRDHSFRIPRPDLSEELGTPNSCTYCHADKSNRWAMDHMKNWYGASLKSNYGAMVAAGIRLDENGFEKIATIINDDLFPPHIRATALSAMAELNDTAYRNLLAKQWADIEPSVRHTSLSQYDILSVEDAQKILPLLNDPVKAVRMDAAYKLSVIPRDDIPVHYRSSLDAAISEYREAMEYTADFATSRHNLGNLYNNLGEPQKAIAQYKEAIRIDNAFYPSKINLAMAYNGLGQNDKAEIIFRDILSRHPEVVGAAYSFGLLLAEMEKYDEALLYLEKAASQQPQNPRVLLNYGQLLDFKGQTAKAQQTLEKSLALEPDNPEIMIRVVEFYLKHDMLGKAKELTLRYQKLYPEDKSAQELLDYIESVMS